MRERGRKTSKCKSADEGWTRKSMFGRRGPFHEKERATSNKVCLGVSEENNNNRLKNRPRRRRPSIEGKAWKNNRSFREKRSDIAREEKDPASKGAGRRRVKSQNETTIQEDAIETTKKGEKNGSQSTRFVPRADGTEG